MTEPATCPKCQARMKAEGLKAEAQLQTWFNQRIEEFLASKGRRMIGWDEILEGGLAAGATVMSWRGEQGGKGAAALTKLGRRIGRLLAARGFAVVNGGYGGVMEGASRGAREGGEGARRRAGPDARSRRGRRERAARAGTRAWASSWRR